MARSVRIPGPYRYALFALVLLSWSSGIAFFSMNRWMQVEGEFGPQKHPWQMSVLEIHGAAAFCMMIAFGALLSAHVPAGWRARSLRSVGVALVAAPAFLALSGHLLYYLGDEQLRLSTSYAHAAVGFCLPFLLLVHVLQGAARRRRRSKLAEKRDLVGRGSVPEAADSLSLP